MVEWSFWVVLLVMVAIAFLPPAFLILRPPGFADGADTKRPGEG